VKEVKKNQVILHDGTTINCGIIVWSTGVGPRSLITSLPWKKTSQGRLLVDEYQKVLDHDGIFAAGDCCEIVGNPLPATAQVAQQQGAYLAKFLNNEAKGKKTSKFEFHFLGMMTYIGNYKTILDTEWIKGSGFLEWFAWRSVYLTRLGSFKNKFQVPFNWLRTLIWGRDVSNF